MKKNTVKNPLIGADIELFLMDKRTKEIVSSEGYIKGTKHEPFNFDKSNKYFATSLDNVLSEFCIPPVSEKDKFIEYIQKGVQYINSVVPDHLCTVALPAAILDDKYLQTDNAKTFGCEPDYCVWTRGINDSPKAANPNLRSGGGHIHIGFDSPTIEVQEALVKAMDLFVGVPSVLLEPDNERKSLYGKAGCFRIKEYGVEYRTVSNYYLEKPELTSWVYDNTMKAIDFVNDGNDIDNVGGLIQRAINNNDKRTAKKIVKMFDVALV